MRTYLVGSHDVVRLEMLCLTLLKSMLELWRIELMPALVADRVDKALR